MAKAANEPSTELIVPEQAGAIEVFDPSMYLDDAGKGLQNATSKDFALPFIYLLQDLSPQVKKREPTYVQGAEPGMFCVGNTNELLNELRFISVDYEMVYIEWRPRNAGGGLVRVSQTMEEAVRHKIPDYRGTDKSQLARNTFIADTANYYGLYLSEQTETWEQGMLSWTSTKLKESRRWNSKMRAVKIQGPKGKVDAPTYSRIYRITSVSEKNDKGTYFIPKVEEIEGVNGWVRNANVFKAAKTFFEDREAGKLVVDLSRSTGGGEEIVVEGEFPDDGEPAM